MSGIEISDFSTPDEVRRPDHTTIEVVKIADGEVGRYTFQPGWRWSEHIRVRHRGRCVIALFSWIARRFGLPL